MNKTLLVVLLLIIGFLLFTNTSLERSVSNGAQNVGTELVDESTYFATDASNSLLALIDNLRVTTANSILHAKNVFHNQIVNNTKDKSFLSYFFYFLLTLLSIFFIYKLLYYVLVLLLLYYLILFIKNKFW